MMLHCSVVGSTLASGQHPTDQHGRAAQKALRAVHDHGFLHGDVCDDNIVITRAADGTDGVRLIDFASSSSGATVELQQAEELQLASVFSAKVDGAAGLHPITLAPDAPESWLTSIDYTATPCLPFLRALSCSLITPPIKRTSPRIQPSS
jgi:hypothetical protein